MFIEVFIIMYIFSFLWLYGRGVGKIIRNFRLIKEWICLFFFVLSDFFWLIMGEVINRLNLKFSFKNNESRIG